METIRTQLTAMTNEVNERMMALANINTRARGGFGAIFGPDSTQSEQAGRTRISERKRASAKRTTSPVS